MTVTSHDKYVFALGVAVGVVLVGITLEAVATYAAKKNMESTNGNVRSTGDGSSKDDTAIGGGIRLSEKLRPLARSTGESTDILESTYSDERIP